ncbi:MAG: hypothetical protein ACRD5K_15940 [Candidatus Acidiferrales bacterium]
MPSGTAPQSDETYAVSQKTPSKLGDETRPANRGGSVHSLRNHLIAFLLCLGLAFVFTLPGSLSLNSGLLGFPGDNFQHAWFLWHFAHAVLNGHNPFYTHLLFYPTRVNLTWSTTDPLAGFFALPLSIFAGPVVAYNFSLILQLALGAFCARLLCLRISQNEIAAFVGGIVFGFSPYLMAHALEHLSLVTAFPIPLFALALDWILSRDSPPWRTGIPLGLALLLAALAHFNYAVICIVFATFCLAIEIWGNYGSGAWRYLGRIWKPLATGVATFLIGFSPFLWMTLGARSEVPGPRGVAHIEVMSADAFGFAIPSWNHIFFGKLVRGLNPDLFRAGVEGTVYIGAVALALAAIGFWKGKGGNRGWATRAVILGIAFWFLSLGSRIHVLGRELHVPGPAALFFELPFAKFVSAPARFDVIVALCLAILCSLGAKYLLDSPANRHRRYWAVPLVVALLLADYLTIPFPRASTVDPGTGYYVRRLNPNPVGCTVPQKFQHGTILAFPLIQAPYCLKSMWMQVADHGRFAIVSGYLSYTPPDAWKPFWKVRILRSLMSLEGQYQMPIDATGDAASAAATIRELNLSAAVVYDSPQHDAAVAYMENVFGAKPERDGSCTVFGLQASESAQAGNAAKSH